MGEPIRFREIKREIRILGVDDSRFDPTESLRVDVVGAVYRGGYWLEGVISTNIEVDGFDSSDRIAEMVNNSPHSKQLRVIITDGLTFAGFNVLDISLLYRLTGIPVIALADAPPDIEEIRAAIRNLPDWERRWKAMQNAGRMLEVRTRSETNPVYLQIAGINYEDAAEIVTKAATRSRIPEPLRAAHLIASGIRPDRAKKQTR